MSSPIKNVPATLVVNPGTGEVFKFSVPALGRKFDVEGGPWSSGTPATYDGVLYYIGSDDLEGLQTAAVSVDASSKVAVSFIDGWSLTGNPPAIANFVSNKTAASAIVQNAEDNRGTWSRV
ncbi:hypothetical protein FA15DRAFT_670932 [Coprinopsis marcescibilis]|uniref:Uncharacterized protein n=1 Tax=Coprinopsis marcescibilis TaxID=230819 RepID=A0A5C3KT27_COPMA|nr:hypothetical protein FA15DRAFT_670932 [Coprinopsis marcescibilis]